MSTHTQGATAMTPPLARKRGGWGRSERMTAHSFLSNKKDKEKVREAAGLMGCSQGEVIRKGIELAWRAAKRTGRDAGEVSP